VPIDVVVAVNSQRPTWNLFAGCGLYATGGSILSFLVWPLSTYSLQVRRVIVALDHTQW